MSQPYLSAIYRYPVKSLRGESFQDLQVDARGFAFDRQWMVVDLEGRFLTQRQQPRMALIGATVGEGGVLRLQAPGMPGLDVIPRAAPRQAVQVWDDRLPAALAADEADGWLSRFLGLPCRLVWLPGDVHRPVDPQYARPADEVGFADGFPFLLIAQASLDDLNARLDHPVPMQRFRPNLVVHGCPAHAEDGWRRIRIGGLDFRVAKPCSRCIIPTIDIETGARGREPMQTLLTYRRRDNKVYFGQNLIHDGSGRLAVGMRVEVLE